VSITYGEMFDKDKAKKSHYHYSYVSCIGSRSKNYSSSTIKDSTKSNKDCYLSSRSSVTIFQTKKNAYIMIVIVIALLVDMIFSTFLDILNDQSVSIYGLVLFIITILIIYGVG
jgi:hypothetical protein